MEKTPSIEGNILVQVLQRTTWRFLKKLKTELPYDPEIPLLGIYMEKTVIPKDIYTPKFTATLLTMARTWKQPKHLSTDERIKKVWNIYVMEYCESESEVAQSCLTLCDPMDCSPPGSSVHEIFQARVLEWLAISFSRKSS